MAPLLVGEASAAAYATGGSGIYRDQVLWLTWGGGTNGTHAQPLGNGSSTSASIQVAAGQSLDVTCSLSNASGKALTSYRPGNYFQDTFDNLYNIGGTDGANQLIAGIARSAGQVTFTVNCSATIGGNPYRLRGLVMADAESTAATEYVQATARGTWTVVEMRKNLSAGPYMATKTNAGSGSQTIRFTGNDNNTAAVTILTFTTPAPNVSMDFDIRGGGLTAISIGLLVPFADFGDAPASYGEAMHVIADLNIRPDGVSEGTPVDLNTSGYQPGALLPPGVNYLGSQGPDTEPISRYSADALGDDISPMINLIEENGWAAGSTLSTLDAGRTISKTVMCAGSGTVAGWLDLDRSGAFDANERSAALCTAGSAQLSWILPVALTPGALFARLRYALDAEDVASPIGVATSGEVEDHMLTVRSPSLRITKTNNAVGGIWAVNQPAATYGLTVTNTSLEPTGRLPTIPAAPITVLDKLPGGIVPRWTGTHVSNGWSCTFVGVDITCVSNQLLAAGGSSSITLPVSIPETVPSGPLINYASVGGGYDPHNGGVPPVPGAVCADAAHCASNTVTIDATPGLSLVKTGTLNDLNGNALIDLGETIRYDFVVTNIGKVTLTNVSVADPLLSGAVPPVAITPGAQTLAPGATATFTALYTPVQADIDSGSVTNTATASGTPPSGPPTISPPATVTVPPDLTTGITILKTGVLNDLDADDAIDAGETITYTFVVTNTGLVTLDGVRVADPMLSGAVPPVATTPLSTTLIPGASATFTATYTPTQAQIDSGSVTNTATGNGTPPGDPEIISPPSTVTVPPNVTPSLSIVKTGVLDDLNGNGLLNLGETIRYSFQVVNTGGVTLSDVTVVDPLVTVVEPPQTLAPGGTYRFTAVYTPVQADIDAGAVTNVAYATGTPPSGPDIDSPTDTVTIPPDNGPGLSIIKTGTLNDLDGNALINLGETIGYRFLVTNTGLVTLTDVTVSDALVAVLEPAQTLAPGGSFTFTALYTPVQADIDVGAVTNVANATGQPPTGGRISSPPDTVTIPPFLGSGLEIDKTGTLNDRNGDGLLDGGETISYSFLVTNTGAVTL